MLVVAIREARRPAQALTWLTVGFVLPILGFVGYLITSNPLRIRRERLTSPYNESDKLPDSFSRSSSVIAHSLRQFSVHGLKTSRVQVLTNGSETFATLMESLHNAQRTIDLEYYIFRHDGIGSRMTELLIERAREGVRIRFIRDGWASRKFPRSEIARMMDAGIECRTMFPLRFPWVLSTLNYRDHCKIVVIDGREAFTGGINAGDEYLGLNPNIGFWRDTHLRIVGEVQSDLQDIFDAHWKIASPERVLLRRGSERAQYRLRNIEAPIAAHSRLSTAWNTEIATFGGTSETELSTERPYAYVQTLEGNPEIPTQIVRQAYFTCVTQADKTIDITTPYFIPDADIIMAIKTAVARGVRVRLLVPHRVVPGVVGPASRTYYGELVEAGVHIYLYDKGMLHAKVMTIDGELSIVGAANYDMRSFRLDYEVCEVVYNVDVARGLTEQFNRDVSNSIPLRIEDLQRRSVPQRIREQAARLLSPLL
ncbi:phospholipase D-like domain-containing protein [Alicyclobacillus dauci]|uniref:Phospholipase D-like domain-containing protein n=2 Tax=Alicyclobacillus dauci TaxID=1475485 RepID=A0ABY6YZ34_9BACL|nr:phospholipase D-like domain-containing protein [Alicyclobacillus dauci]